MKTYLQLVFTRIICIEYTASDQAHLESEKLDIDIAPMSVASKTKMDMKAKLYVSQRPRGN